MYLFLLIFVVCLILSFGLYIPKCIYFYVLTVVDNVLPRVTLHSKMYLFLPYMDAEILRSRNGFTFQNVSISTGARGAYRKPLYLYIPKCIYFYDDGRIKLCGGSTFTFQNVSISTQPVFAVYAP